MQNNQIMSHRTTSKERRLAEMAKYSLINIDLRTKQKKDAAYNPISSSSCSPNHRLTIMRMESIITKEIVKTWINATMAKASARIAIKSMAPVKKMKKPAKEPAKSGI